MKLRRPKNIKLGWLSARAVKRYPAKGASFYVREDGRAYYQVRAAGSRATVHAGWATPDEIAEILGRLLAKGVPQAEPERRSKPGLVRTVGELADLWVAAQHDRVLLPRARGGISARTAAFYEKAARHHKAWLGEVSVRSLSKVHQEDYAHARLVKEGASPRLVQSELARLRQAWRWGLAEELLPERVLPVYRIAVDEKEFVICHRTPRPAEVEAVLGHVRGEPGLAIRVLAVTGARVGEACKLTAADLDRFQGTVRLGEKTTPRWFPLERSDPVLFQELSRRARARPLDARLLDLHQHAREQVRNRLRRACASAGVPRFTPHGLRRMVVNRLIDAGVDAATAASLTGHSVEVMLRFYREPTPRGLADAVARADLGSFGGRTADRSQQGG